MKTNSELDDELSLTLDSHITALNNLELMDREIERLSTELDLSEAITKESELFELAAKNLGFEYLLD